MSEDAPGYLGPLDPLSGQVSLKAMAGILLRILVSDSSDHETEMVYLVAKGLSGLGRDTVDGNFLFMAEAAVTEFHGQYPASEGQV